MEGDRFRNIKMDFLNLEPEREVVRSERLLRTDNSPMGRLDERLSYTFYRKSPYRWSTVGWMSDLIAIPQSTVEEYFQAHYMPNNAFALFVGDVHVDEVMNLLEEHMGDLEAGTLPPEPDLSEELATSQSHVPVVGNVKTPTLQLVYPTPKPASKDWPVFEVLNAILTQGRSSRLQQSLVYGDDPIANSIGAFLFPMRGPTPYSISVQGRPDAYGSEIIDKVQGELDLLATKGPTEKELLRAVRGLRSKVIRHMQSMYGRAQTIGFWIRATGNPTLPFEHLETLGEVSTEDVQRVASKYLAQMRRTTGSVINPQWLRESILALLPESEGTEKAIKNAYTQSLEALTIYERILILQGEINLEAKAIRLLHERATIARSEYEKSGQTEKIKLLDHYMKEADKGATKRRQELGNLHQGLAKLQDAGAQALQAAKKAKESVDKSQSTEHIILDFLLKTAEGANPRPPILNLAKEGLEHLNTARALALGYALSVSGGQLLFEDWFTQQKGSKEMCQGPSREGAMRRGCDLLRQLKPIAMESRWEVQR